MTQEPQLSPEQKEKVFSVAKGMKKSCYMLTTVFLEDVGRWGLLCTAKIGGTPYQSMNYLDDYEARDHVDIFRNAFSRALEKWEKQNKALATLH